MAYSIPTVLGNGAAGNSIVIADGSLDSTSTTLSLPGRNYSGYGQPVDTNFVKMVQCFANSSVPGTASQLLAGQLWFDTNGATAGAPGTLKIYAGFPNVWLSIVASDPNNTSSVSSFKGELNVQGNVVANDLSIGNTVSIGNSVTIGNVVNTSNLNANGNVALTGPVTSVTNLVTSNLTAGVSNAIAITAATTTFTGTSNVVLQNGNLTVGGTTTVTGTITGGNLATGGNITAAGNLSVTTNGSIGGNFTVTGNISAKGADQQVQYNNAGNIFGATGVTWNNGTGLLTISNANVTTTLTTTNITAGASGTAGTITGQWTLSAGSRLNATYADLAERFAADDYYEPGTVVELGGMAEITAVKDDLSDRVFGVISETAGYLMNAEAGTNKTHPPVAMQGRVSVKVKGRVNKGDRLVAAGKGMARSADITECNSFNTIGRALESKLTDDTGFVLAAVSAKTV